MNPNFYRALEDRFRGSRTLIKRRLASYRPFLRGVASTHPGGAAVDLGCGRGEFLELLNETGLQALGVDLDAGMLADCISRELPVRQADAIEHLRSLPEASHVLVSAFHVIEHVPFRYMQELLAEALRVLRPGGLLILETPNAENLVVGTSSFYLDPTHERPIHSELLAFCTEYAGFARHKVLRLSEDPEMHSDRQLGLLDVLGGSSPDCAVVAQKGGDPAALAALESAFGPEYGISLARVADRYDHQLRARLQQVEAGLAQATRRLQQFEVELAAQGAHLHHELAAIRNSRSWRITAPLRSLNATLRPAAGRFARYGVRAGFAVARRVPLFKSAAVWCLQASPLLARLVARFSDPASGLGARLSTATRIHDFDQLRSVRIMRALAQQASDNPAGPVTFLQVSDDGR